MVSVTQPVEVCASPVHSTGDITATQPVEAPDMIWESATIMTATRPVEAPSTGRFSTQPVKAPCATADVLSQPTGTSSGDGSAVDRSLTSSRTVAADNTGVSDIEDKLCSELEFPDVASDREVLSDRDLAKDDKLDQELSEEAN